MVTTHYWSSLLSLKDLQDEHFLHVINYLPSSCTWSLELNLTSLQNSNTPTGIVYQLHLNLASHDSGR